METLSSYKDLAPTEPVFASENSQSSCLVAFGRQCHSRVIISWEAARGFSVQRAKDFYKAPSLDEVADSSEPRPTVVGIASLSRHSGV